MYIRIQDNSIRYRISRAESVSLLQGEVLQERIILASDFQWLYQLKVSDETSEFTYQNASNLLSLIINRDALTSELENRPTKAGIEVAMQPTSQTTRIYLQVDLKKN